MYFLKLKKCENSHTIIIIKEEGSSTKGVHFLQLLPTARIGQINGPRINYGGNYHRSQSSFARSE